MNKQVVKKIITLDPDNQTGFVYINKPASWTSHDVVAVMRRKFNTKKVGHAGTLDPLATGVLILAIGKTTKLLDYWHIFPKTYITNLEFGKISNTYDIEGETKDVKVEKTNIPDKKLLEKTLDKFIGEQDQLPPAFSAKKINGQKAYTLARAGKKVKLKYNKITIYNISLLEFNYPKAKIKITCSTGTYIRSVIHDLGQILNCGAIMTNLIRTDVGFIDLKMCDELDKNSDTFPTLHPVSDLQKEIINFNLKNQL